MPAPARIFTATVVVTPVDRAELEDDDPGADGADEDDPVEREESDVPDDADPDDSDED